MLELAALILNLTQSKSKLNFQAFPSDDPKQRKPDISLAQQELNWSPKISLENGLKETIRYFKNIL